MSGKVAHIGVPSTYNKHSFLRNHLLFCIVMNNNQKKVNLIFSKNPMFFFLPQSEMGEKPCGEITVWN